MTEKQLITIEQKLAKAGYHKYNNTSSSNANSWFKTIRSLKDPGKWLYKIEWRVWNYLDYIDCDPSLAKQPYTMDLCIIVNIGDHAPAEMEMPDILSIEQAEELAAKFYTLVFVTDKQTKKKK